MMSWGAIKILVHAEARDCLEHVDVASLSNPRLSGAGHWLSGRLWRYKMLWIESVCSCSHHFAVSDQRVPHLMAAMVHISQSSSGCLLSPEI